ncbi:acyl-CoA thioesterase [Sphingomonas oligophenolica]|uniref:Acyl-CoA thioesterase 2 n=1 Tax=Sphingomonas oligophenolica TaxID=301154 RepID=A0A502CFD9_9SPHN|nr:acyl-CoA thioesterase II [Sphingomonas oligophenolica]TPG12435.1 acyl-CoA thioesterase II [Sphingomonas oligophenolica]
MTDDTWTPPSPETLAAALVDLLDVEEIDTDLYRGARNPGGKGRVFGGQVIAQALQAAQRSTEGKAAHSIHAYFMRAGDEQHPIVFRVVRDFEGKSFATRRVVALQKGQPILNLAASFQVEEDGLHHHDAMPADIPPPENLTSESELRREQAHEIPEKFREMFLRRRSPIDIRPLYPRSWFTPVKRDPVNYSWFRCVAPIGDDPATHRAVLAYASDMALMATSMMPHGVNWMTPGMQSASLDHALWLHEPVRADEWLLYATDSPWAGHGRGMNRGSIYTRDGRLVASVAQEGLIRMRSEHR